MGEARRRSRSRAEVLSLEERCVYCSGVPETLEHMPPRAMFRGKYRPSGLEFGCCRACNEGTSAADLVASFFSRVAKSDDDPKWLLADALDFQHGLNRRAPRVLEEIYHGPRRNVSVRRPSGLIVRQVQVKVDGPATQAHLSVFGAKLGLALWREHVGAPLPLDGWVTVNSFLNAGLNDAQASSILSVLPGAGELRQGQSVFNEQFAYRYNSDLKTILAALVGFHGNLHFFVMAFSDPRFLDVARFNAGAATLRPGQLISHLAPCVYHQEGVQESSRG